MAEYLYLRVSAETKKLLMAVSRQKTPFEFMTRICERYILEGIERDLRNVSDDRIQRLLVKARSL